MSAHELVFDQAMAAFVAAHQAGTLESIPSFLQRYPFDERDAILDAIEEYLELEAEIALFQPDAETLDIVRHARGAVLAALDPTPISLTDLRVQRNILTPRLARMLILPADFLARLERGGVPIATIPQRQLSMLVSRLATALQQTEAQIRAALATPVSDMAGVRLSADDDTTIEETPMSFVEALEKSAGLNDQMRQEWLGNTEP